MHRFEGMVYFGPHQESKNTTLYSNYIQTLGGHDGNSAMYVHQSRQ